MNCPICQGTGNVPAGTTGIGEPYSKRCPNCKGSGVGTRLDEKIAAGAKASGLTGAWRLRTLHGRRRNYGRS